MKARKPSVWERSLVHQCEERRRISDDLRADNFKLRKQVDELTRALQERQQNMQLVSRERLAASLAQLTEAISKAIMFTVAKEAI